MTRFLNGKAFVAVPLIVFLLACASQSAPVNYGMTELESTGSEVSTYAHPAQAGHDDPYSLPSTHAAIGEFTDLLRGEPLGVCCEAAVQ